MELCFIPVKAVPGPVPSTASAAEPFLPYHGANYVSPLPASFNLDLTQGQELGLT